MNCSDPGLLAVALESIDEGVGIYDAEDRLVAFNSSYAKLRSAIGGDVALGVRWDDLITASIRAGTIPEAVGREEKWLERRRRLRGAYSIIRRLPDGRSYQINERRMPHGGIAVVWTEITALVHRSGIVDGAPTRYVDAVTDSSTYGSGTALASYDPNELASKAQRWRELAAQADPVHREIYLRLAAKCELLVRQSIYTPPIAD